MLNGSGVEDWDYAFASNESSGVLSVDVTECMWCADDVTNDATVDCDGRPVDGVPHLMSGHSVYRYCCEDSVLLATALAMESAEQKAGLFGKIARNDGTGSYRPFDSFHVSDISLFLTIKYKPIINRIKEKSVSEKKLKSFCDKGFDRKDKQNRKHLTHAK